jgi:hypothetical protein
VDVMMQPKFTVGKPRVVFEGRYIPRTGGSPADYDVSPDGQRFLMIKGGEETPATQINIIQNWFEELKQKVPTGKK